MYRLISIYGLYNKLNTQSFLSTDPSFTYIFLYVYRTVSINDYIIFPYYNFIMYMHAFHYAVTDPPFNSLMFTYFIIIALVIDMCVFSRYNPVKSKRTPRWFHTKLQINATQKLQGNKRC